MNISLYPRSFNFEFENDESVLSINDTDDLEKNLKKIINPKVFPLHNPQNYIVFKRSHSIVL